MTRRGRKAKTTEGKRTIIPDRGSSGAFSPLQIRQMLRWRDDIPNSVSWSPDGKLLVSGSEDCTIKVWNFATGTLTRIIEGHSGPVQSVAWAPGGRWLASGSADGTVKVWDVTVGNVEHALERTLEGHQESVWSVAWSPDGQFLASASTDNTVRVWEAATGREVHILEGHRGAVRSVAWSPDGQFLTSGAGDRTVRVWKAATGREVRILEGRQEPVWSVAWSPDGQFLASASTDNTVRVWEAATGREVRTLQVRHDSVRSVAWSPDGQFLASASFYNMVQVWEVRTGDNVHTLRGHWNSVRSVAWSPDGQFLTSGAGDRTVRVWKAATGREVHTLRVHHDSVRSAAWSPDGQLLASGADDNTVRVWEACSGREARILQGHRGSVRSVAWSPDGQLLASASTDNTVRVWEAHSGREGVILQGPQGSFRSVAWSPDSQFLASGSTDPTVRVWEVRSGREVRTLQGHREAVRSVAWSPDGQLLASGADDNTVRVWEVRSNQEEFMLTVTLQGHRGAVRSMAWSPDGQLLASGADDNTVRVWEAATGRAVRTLEGHRDPVWSVAWSPDGKWLISSSNDGDLRVWSCNSWQAIKRFEPAAPKYLLLTIAFCPPTQTATVFGDEDVIVQVWNIATGFVLDDQPTTAPAIHYTSAKIVFVGESNVGKSCLALRLAEDYYEEPGTTHGMKLWSVSPEKFGTETVAPVNEKRNVILWDLGGQDEYRLVHQLFLHDTTLALILFDPTRGRTAFEEVEGWNLRLEKQLHGRKAVKLLVGTKLDEETTIIDQAGLQQLLSTCGFAGYLPTSAKTSRGIAELRTAIAQALDWDNLSKTTRPILFQRVHTKIEALRNTGEVIVLYKDLEDQVRQENLERFDPADVDTVVKQLALQGMIVDTRETSGQRVLVLRIEEIERYAGSLIIAARDNPSGVPALEEQFVTAGRMIFPGIKDRDRLSPTQERAVLKCIVQLLLEHGICLKHAGLLIFPTLFPTDAAQNSAQTSSSVSLYYDFSGAIDNIYSSLVVRIALSERFGRVRLWQDGAEFEQPGQDKCGLRKINNRHGVAHLDLLFGPGTTDEVRRLFTVFVEDHLRNEGVNITEVLESTCTSCDYRFEGLLLHDRLANGLTDILCPRCETRNPINQGAARARASNPVVEEELFALKTTIAERSQRSVADIKREFKPIEVFYSYAHEDEALRNELAKHLSILQRNGVITSWHDRNVSAGTDWQGTIDQRLNSATLILLLVSADFLASDYCYDVEMKRALERHRGGEARVIPVILRPVDWREAEFGDLQALPIDAKPVTAWANKDEAFVNIAQGIRTAIEDLLRPPSLGPPTLDRALTPGFTWQPLTQPPIRMLHLSDLHITTARNPTARLQPLIADLRDTEGGLGFERLDYLVISGDLTNRGSAEEFELAYQFISRLIERFELTAERCVIVPGNHDLSWDQLVYNWRQKRLIDEAKQQPGSFVRQGDGYLVRDDEQYPQRFVNFGKFYHSLVQQPYHLKAEEQCLSFLFTEPRLQFLAMNSAWEIDEFFKNRSSINDSALSNGLLKADEQITKAKAEGHLTKDASVLRIAVWHHPATGNEKIQSDAFLERLRQADVRLCLHGHVHEDRAELIGYMHPRKIHIAGAGSFGAVAKDRPESTPRLYNVIEIARDHSRIKVYTRCMKKEGGAWEGWAVWPGENAYEKRTYYEIKFSS